MSEAFQGLIIQIDVGDFDFGFGKRIDVDRKTVVLSRDLHLSRWNS